DPCPVGGDARHGDRRAAAYARGQGLPCRLWHDPPVLRPPRYHTQKKTAHASEQDRPDILRRRQAWFESQLDLSPEHLVFIDETWASTNMARGHSRGGGGQSPRGRRAHGA